MDKKDLENLSVSELLKLKESINDEIEKKAHPKDTFFC
jgi:hypothetical protein